MMQVTQSPLLQALGYAIINSVWQFALLWLVYMAVNSFIKLSAHQRYVTALTLQFVGFTWFIGTLVFYYGESAKNIVSGFEVIEYTVIAEAAGSKSFKEMFFSALLRAELLLPYLSVAYLILISWFSLKMVKAYRHTQYLKTTGLQKINVDWRLFVQNLSEQLGIKQKVSIFISTLVESPVTIGYLKPVILLPVAVVNNLSIHQIEAILVHELAHIKRYDYIFNIILSVIEVSLFFNPFMQLLSKQMKKERENSCDDWVLQYEYNACNYAQALLKIATFKTNASTGFAVNAVENKRALLIRVKRMIEKKDFYRNYRQQIASLVFITLLISCLAWFTPKKYIGQKNTTNATQPIKPVESLMAKVENPLFNPVFFLSTEDKKDVVTDLKLVKIEVNKATEIVSNATVIKDVEMAIAEQFAKEKTEVTAKPDVREIHSVNLVLDSALFKNFATRDLVVSEIKKLKKEFESFDKSSLFENINWKQFWDNTKVQNQLELAFKQLKEIELQQKNVGFAMNAVARTMENNHAIVNSEQARLKALTSKKLATIVQERIIDIKTQGEKKKGAEFGFTIDLSELPTLHGTNDAVEWSFSYNDKTNAPTKLVITSKPKAPCAEPKEIKREPLAEKIADPKVRAENLRRAAPRIRVVRI